MSDKLYISIYKNKRLLIYKISNIQHMIEYMSLRIIIQEGLTIKIFASK